MSGSLTWFEYTTNQGSRVALLLDESNARAQGFTFEQGLFSIRPAPIMPFPGRAQRGFSPRRVTTVNTADPSLRRTFVIFSRVVFDAIVTSPEFFIATGGGAVQGDYWAILGTYHESYPLRPNFFIDTGQFDGTLSARS